MKPGEHLCVNCGMRCQSLYRGKAANEAISIGGELHDLSHRIPCLEKTSRRTPPKHMVAEWEKVKQAIVLLAAAKERKIALEAKLELLTTLFGGGHWIVGKEYIT